MRRGTPEIRRTAAFGRVFGPAGRGRSQGKLTLAQHFRENKRKGETDMADWFRLSKQETMSQLTTGGQGLDSREAKERLNDGTKIESKANRYTFVWRKNVERNRARLLEKIRILLQQIDDVVAQEDVR